MLESSLDHFPMILPKQVDLEEYIEELNTNITEKLIPQGAD